MNTTDRIKMVKAMEYIARHVEDEEVFQYWLVYGVADEDIALGDLSVKRSDLDDLGVYIEDEDFADIMKAFLKLMRSACRSGGLTCDNVTT